MQLASLMLIAASYLVDSSHTTAGFAVKHMMVATVRGQFDTVAGKVEIDDADLTRCRIDVTIEAASVDTRNAKRDEHLRGADFFDVAKYPFITFKSSHFENAAEGRTKTGRAREGGASAPTTPRPRTGFASHAALAGRLASSLAGTCAWDTRREPTPAASSTSAGGAPTCRSRSASRSRSTA